MIAAFFDIDGTLSRTSLMIEHFNFLVKYDIIDEDVWLNRIQPIYEQYDKRYREYDHYLAVLSEVYKDKLRKINRQFNEYISQRVVEMRGEIVYKYARSRIQFHHDHHHHIFFISGSPDFLVSEMGKKYGVFAYRGSTYHVDEKDYYTGEVKELWSSKSKNIVLNEFVDKYNIDLVNSYAYGDTSGDFSMLKRVGHPTAINPTRELIGLIQDDPDLKAKAKIIVERKDVVYHFNPSVNLLEI